MQHLIDEARRAIGQDVLPEGMKNAPKDVDRYYKDCRKKQKGKSKEYCARVAWQIYCMHKNPDYKGCTKFGKTKGPPYSKPIS